MSYRAPVRDLALSLQIAGHPALVSGAFAELDDDTVAAVLEAAGAFTEEQLAPLNRKGDQVGARLFGRVPVPVWRSIVAVVLGAAGISALVRLLS